jgi:hypothetical protein
MESLSKHRWWYCTQTFKVKGNTFTYICADFEFVDGLFQSVIKFRDGQKTYTMTETEFFNKVSPSVFKLPL